MTVASIVVFLLGFFIACLLGLIACRLIWVRAVRLTRARLERDRPETLRSFEARIAGAQARAAISIRELERALERERQISAQARLMADQMTSSSALALAERDDTQDALVNLSDTLNTTREHLLTQEEALARSNNVVDDLRRELGDARAELSMRDEDINRLNGEVTALRAELAQQMAGDGDPNVVLELAKAGNASAMARSQIEQLRETVRTLRAEKNAAEASAARARLMLDARDDNQAVAAAKTDFAAERERMVARIAKLESQLRDNQQTAPQWINVNKNHEPETDVPTLVTPSTGPQSPRELDSLRRSVDAMTASLTAQAAVDQAANDRVNALLDEAEREGADSNLVTSLVEARDRLRARKSVTGGNRKPAHLAAPTKLPPTRPAKGAGKSAKISAATVSGGAPVEKQGGMPRASENDLKVI